MTRSRIKLFISTTLFFLSAISLLGITTYAWFIITNTNNTSLISQVSDIEAEYEFYRFKDSWHNGNPSPALMDQMCESETDDQCYLFIPNPTEMFDLDEMVAPGERFSFAIKIVSLGNEAYLDLDLGQITSSNVPIDGMPIQYTFSYEVSKVSYIIDLIETEDQKDLNPIVHYQGYFDGDDQTIYPLIHHVPMNVVEGDQVMIIIYFDFFFDPSVMGVNSLGIPYDNQNHLAGQSLHVEDIYMVISPSLN